MERDHLEMILEDINSKFDIILEGYDSLRGEIRELSQRTDERFDMVDFKFDILNKKIDGVDEKLTKKIDAVDERLTKKIDAVDKKLTEKIDAVEDRLSRKIDGVAADLGAHRRDTEVHRGYQVRED